MKVKVEENPQLTEIEVLIKCPIRNDEVEKIIESISINSYTIIGKKDNDNYMLSLNDIFYFEAVDNPELNVFSDNKFPQKYYKILESTSPYIVLL